MRIFKDAGELAPAPPNVFELELIAEVDEINNLIAKYADVREAHIYDEQNGEKPEGRFNRLAFFFTFNHKKRAYEFGYLAEGRVILNLSMSHLKTYLDGYKLALEHGLKVLR